MKKTRGKPDKRKNFKIFLTASLVAVALIAVVLSVLFLGTGATANTATSSRSLTPIGYPVGSASASALVVYDPGSTGAAKGIADDIASNLQAQGYFVSLAGIKSTMAASNASQYQVVVVGGPIDAGKASSSVQSYLSNLTPANNTKVGVFGIGTADTPNSQIAPLPSNSTFAIKEILEINPNQGAIAESTEFVTQLLS